MASPKRELTISEVARMGGKARSKKLTAAQRKESARHAVNARWKRWREQKQREEASAA